MQTRSLAPARCCVPQLGRARILLVCLIASACGQTADSATDSTTTSTTTQSPLVKFRAFPNSAISMQGKNYYVNFDSIFGTSDRVADFCLKEPTCVCFDFDAPLGQVGTGWLHRVPPECAAVAGGMFLNGTASGSTLFERLPPYRQDNITGTCVLPNPSTGDPTMSTEKVAATVFITLMVTLAASAGVVVLVLMAMHLGLIRVPGAAPPPDPDMLPLNDMH